MVFCVARQRAHGLKAMRALPRPGEGEAAPPPSRSPSARRVPAELSARLPRAYRPRAIGWILCIPCTPARPRLPSFSISPQWLRRLRVPLRPGNFIGRRVATGGRAAAVRSRAPPLGRGREGVARRALPSGRAKPQPARGLRLFFSPSSSPSRGQGGLSPPRPFLPLAALLSTTLSAFSASAALSPEPAPRRGRAPRLPA